MVQTCGFIIRHSAVFDLPAYCPDLSSIVNINSRQKYLLQLQLLKLLAVLQKIKEIFAMCEQQKKGRKSIKNHNK